MDYLGEAIALGIDVLILGACVKQYFKNKRAISMIQVCSFLITRYLGKTVLFVGRPISRN